MKRLLKKIFELPCRLNATLEIIRPSFPFSFIRLIVIYLLLTPHSTLFAASETDRRLDSVTLKLKWKHQFQFAGYYAALEKGFYRQEGLDVKIIEAKEGVESTETVLNGDAEFGTAMSDLVLHRAKGRPVVVLASIFQHSPLIILVPKSTGIQNIHDLSGKRIALELHSEEIAAYLKHEGIPLSEMVVHAHSYDTSPLLNGEIDAMSAYSTDEPFMLLKKGIEYHAFSARSGGIDFYGDTLFTTEQQVLEHPERVAAFLRASIAGWEYALRHSEEIIDLILSKYSRRHSREHLVFESEMTKRLIMADIVGVGYMNPGRWKHIFETYAGLGMADKNYSLEGFIYDPNPRVDLKRLYISLAGVILITVSVFLIALRFYKLNQSLKEEIRERQQAENALKKEKDTAQKYLDIAGVMFVVLNTEGEVILINRKGCEVLGYDDGNVIGKNWFDHFVPERMRAEMKDVFSKMKSGKAGTIEYFENPVLTKSGHERIIDWHNSLLMGDAGQITGTLSSGTDITEREHTRIALREAHDKLEIRVRERTSELNESKASLEQKVRELKETQKRLSLIYDSVADALFYIKVEPDDCFRFVSINHAFLKLTGLTSDQIVGKRIEEVIPEPSIQLVLDNYRKAIKEKRIVRWEETSVYPSGEKVGHVSIAPVLNERRICTHLVGSVHDVTERKQAESILRETVERLNEAERIGSFGYWMQDIKTGEEWWSENEYSIHDLPKNVKPNYDLHLDCVHPDDRAAHDREFKEGLASDSEWHSLKYRIVKKDGQVRNILSHYHIERDPQGNPLRAFGTDQDVTEAKRTEEILAKSREFNHAILMSMKDHIAVLDKAGNILSVNSSWLEFARKNDVSSLELVGEGVSYLDVCRRASDDSDETAQKALSGIKAVLDGSQERFELEYACHSPSIQRWFLMTVIPFKGEKGGAVVAHTDISNRKKAEKELRQAELNYRTVADFTYDWEYWQSPDGAFNYMSPSCERITGYSAEEFTDNPGLLDQIIIPEDRNIWLIHRQKGIEKHKPGGVQFRIRRKDGEIRWIEHACQRVLDDRGEFLGLRASNRDISKREFYKSETTKLQKELAHMDRVVTVSTLTTALAHEINQPLAAMRSYAQAALRFIDADEPDYDSVRKALQGIVADNKRAVEVVSRLRDLVKKGKETWETIEINSIIKDVLGLINSQIILRKASVTLDMHPIVPIVHGDSIQIQQVLINLLTNALDAMDGESVEARTITISTRAENSNSAMVSISDSGGGIPPDKMQAVFDPFHTTKPKGIGLGLAICKSIIETHGGTIWVDNNPDGGAIFSFTLPADQ